MKTYEIKIWLRAETESDVIEQLKDMEINNNSDITFEKLLHKSIKAIKCE